MGCRVLPGGVGPRMEVPAIQLGCCRELEPGENPLRMPSDTPSPSIVLSRGQRIDGPLPYHFAKQPACQTWTLPTELLTIAF